MRYDFDGYGYKYIDNGSGSDWRTRIKDAEPLYAKPQRKPLTDEEITLIIADCASSHQHTDIHLARAIEQAHGITGVRHD
jgi:hypothetical protein